MALSIVNVENGSKSYQNKVLFSDASFYLQEGEKEAVSLLFFALLQEKSSWIAVR